MDADVEAALLIADAATHETHGSILAENLGVLGAEVRACHATIRRMVAEREALEVELAKWRR